MMNKLTVVNWNVAWCKNGMARAVMHERIFEYEPDVVCVTEAHTDFLPRGGFQIVSNADYGYPAPPAKRKVVLWSKTPWCSVDEVGSEEIPGGRYVSGITETPCGPVQFVGICIPWSAAHVSTGRRDRKRWEDHMSYLLGLDRIIPRDPPCSILLGDFNQQIPRHTQPVNAFAKLMSFLNGRFAVATAGIIPDVGIPTIDHIAYTKDFTLHEVRGISNIHTPSKDESHRKLSDHIGVMAIFQKA